MAAIDAYRADIKAGRAHSIGAAFYLEAAVQTVAIVRARSERSVPAWRKALGLVRAALVRANQDGDANARRACLRIMNWLRADLRKMNGAY
jgi:hypothetical protein